MTLRSIACLLGILLVAQGQRPADMVIDPAFPTLDVGAALQLRAVDHLGRTVTAKWAISDPLVASISSSGLVTGRTAGMAVVRASVKNVKAETTVTVRDVEPPPPPPPPPDPSGRGPQASITCPAGSLDVLPGQSIQGAIASATSVCIRAGVHAVTQPIVPRTGSIITGEYGAILDGFGWQTPDSSAACIRAMNQDIDGVTIRNLVIRNCPMTGILAFRDHSDRWTIDHVEVGPGYRGVTLPDDFVLSNSYIHHNAGDSGAGGYSCYLSTTGLFLNNEISFNGPEQKCMHGNNVTWRGNYVHHNQGNGIWADGDNPGFLVENNVLEDNALYSIFFEVSTAGIIRNNTVRRAGWAGIMVATSRNVEVYGNTVDGWRGIGMFLFCGAVGGSWPATPNPEGVLPWDLRDVTIRDNVTTLGPQADAFVAQFSYTGCTDAQLLPYQNGSKNLRYVNNTYQVKDPAGRYWFWWNGLKTLAEWQALGHQ